MQAFIRECLPIFRFCVRRFAFGAFLSGFSCFLLAAHANQNIPLFNMFHYLLVLATIIMHSAVGVQVFQNALLVCCVAYHARHSIAKYMYIGVKAGESALVIVLWSRTKEYGNNIVSAQLAH